VADSNGTYTYGFDTAKRATFVDSSYDENTSYDSNGNVNLSQDVKVGALPQFPNKSRRALRHDRFCGLGGL
jgi:hypothetical protein